MKKYNLRLKYGTFAKDGDDNTWRDDLSDDIKDDKGLADFKDIGGLAKAYLDTKADVGRSIRIPGPDADADTIAAFNTDLVTKVPSLVSIPGEKASEEDTAAFFTRLGKPTEATKYVMPADAPEAIKENLNALAAVAFKGNFTQAQFKQMSETMMADHVANTDAATSKFADEYDKLKLDWGPALTNKSQSILELAKQTGAPQQLVDAVANRQMDMDTMKWLDGLITSLSGEGSQMNFQGSGSQDTRVTPAEAKNQIEEIMARKEYWESGNAQQQGLVDKVVALGKIASAA